MIPIKETAMYKHCLFTYQQYLAYKDHEFNPDLQQLNDETLKYLQFDAYQVENDIVVTFVLKQEDVSDGRDQADL